MLLLILSSLLFLFFLIKFSKRSSKLKHLPPGPKKLPLIGNLHHMIGALPHHRLRDLAQTYGPIFHLQLGQISLVAISSPDLAKEVFKTQELAFAQRPSFSYTEMSIFPSPIFYPFGEEWRQLRKIYVTEFLGSQRVRSFKSIREEETSNLINYIRSLSSSPLNLSKKIHAFTNSIVSKAAIGQNCKQQEEFISAVEEAISFTGGFSVSDIFPSLKFLPDMTGMNSKFRMLQRKIDSILDSILDDREIMRREQFLRSKDDTCGREDILDVLLRLRETNELGLNLTTRKIKGIIMDLFVAGSITTSTLIEWTMSELIRNPKVMAKAQAEVRAVLKEKGCLEESELNKLKYLLSIIKESFRLHPPVPLIPREATEEREINGYKVPASSRILTNVMAIGRDPHHWTDPEKFKPERFLESTMDFIGTNFELLPFGSGRRACPGIALANANIEVTLASLLYHFDWKLPNGEAMEKLDMTEAFAGTVTRMNSLNVIAIPYIPTVAA
ncbi:hypothetical protein EUGRSUZ_G03310 [Eucalyptus grandis]|uniref:Uncharacterized protein n=2 Tax=Eucalyptus grandis TaxID=71139 RepID=A0ACC3KA33_EUCGR|nr:hypothetical protein EUGRSUZ_G03310 [Eucalyptus grandis]